MPRWYKFFPLPDLNRAKSPESNSNKESLVKVLIEKMKICEEMINPKL